MATIFELSPEQRIEWAGWKAQLPPAARALAEEFPPNKLYRHVVTNERVIPFDYAEDGTLSVAVLGRFNLVLSEKNIEEVKPSDLEECELPSGEEVVGVYETDLARTV